tara:strand:- start:181 stop:477 length:297 start_codon:yes stop_codon:yes gene_type:complete
VAGKKRGGSLPVGTRYRDQEQVAGRVTENCVGDQRSTRTPVAYHQLRDGRPGNRDLYDDRNRAGGYSVWDERVGVGMHPLPCHEEVSLPDGSRILANT